MTIFSSSPYFKQIYESLAEAGFAVDLLVTEPPRPAGRGRKITKNPAHAFAENINLQVSFELESLSDTQHPIRNTQYDLGLVFAYGRIIPRSVIDQFDRGIINIHPSYLPKYRGASPVQTAILNDDQETGVSIIKVASECDCGDILYQEKVKISKDDTYDTLLRKTMDLCIKNLPAVMSGYLKGKIIPWKQDETQATYTKKIAKTDGEILEADNAKQAICKIRAYSAWPKAYFVVDGKRLIIHSAKLESGKIAIESIQPEGKNRMAFSDFKRGYTGLLTKFPKFVRITEE